MPGPSEDSRPRDASFATFLAQQRHRVHRDVRLGQERLRRRLLRLADELPDDVAVRGYTQGGAPRDVYGGEEPDEPTVPTPDA